MGTTWTIRPDACENWLNSGQWRLATQLRRGLWNDDEDLRCAHTPTETTRLATDRLAEDRSMHCTARTHPPDSSFILPCAERSKNSCRDLDTMWRTSVQYQSQADGGTSWANGHARRPSGSEREMARLLDITARDAEAGRYQTEAQHRPETAAARATKEHNTRYPPKNGAYVGAITPARETWTVRNTGRGGRGS